MKLLNQKSNHLSVKVLASIYGAILLTILILAYTGNLPTWLSRIPYYDTIGHFVLYGIATYLGHLVFKHRKLKLLGYILPLWPVLFGFFTIVEEFIQGFSPNRSLTVLDLVASLIGISFGYWLAKK
ncbi:MAG: VanZ family protein [Spirulinaceae cyanobacterium]